MGRGKTAARSLINRPAFLAYHVLFESDSHIDLPVRVAEISERYDLYVVGAMLRNGMSGFLIKNDGNGGVIMVNKTHAQTRRRFTAAHELGHYLLDTGAERTCNIFAANFLMPSVPFLRLWRELQDIHVCRTGCICALAGAFWVSYAAAAVRVRELNLN